MPVLRIDWADLPVAAHTTVEAHIGPVLSASSASAGVNSGLAVTLRTAEAVLFVKGVPLDHPQARTQEREARINPFLPAASPRLLWRVQAAGWDLIGYERLVGRHADYGPGSSDLALVADAIAELQAGVCPDIELKRAEQRWADYAGPGDAELLAGDALLHTLAPHNLLVNDRAHLIDWAWPTRGAAFIDPAVLILRLMEAGHTAADADAWARRHVASWAAAPVRAVAAFSAASAAAWDEIARADAQEWKKDMARGAHDWVTYWRTH